MRHFLICKMGAIVTFSTCVCFLLFVFIYLFDEGNPEYSDQGFMIYLFIVECIFAIISPFSLFSVFLVHGNVG